jgi:hypothetical protein
MSGKAGSPSFDLLYRCGSDRAAGLSRKQISKPDIKADKAIRDHGRPFQIQKYHAPQRCAGQKTGKGFWSSYQRADRRRAKQH